ncbi:MAG: hypothetical protein ACOCV4_08790 [Myxococcota bacterium]
MKVAAVIVAALGLGTAPFQCASDPDPNRRMEDSAPEALWELSERFEDRGDDGARRETLRHLIERYPSSRYARRAELALDESDEAPVADTASDAP